MPRIRTIKPEFWSSPRISELPPLARLLYVAMWNWADDTGRGKAEPRELMGFAFPLDDDMTVADFRGFLGGIRRVFGVVFYVVDGRRYYSIPSWEKHQKIDKRSASRWPSPDDGEGYDPETNRPADQDKERASWVLDGNSAETRRDLGAGTGEQGNRGTGEQGIKTPAPAVLVSVFDEAWTHWPKKVERKQALERFKAAVKRYPGEPQYLGDAIALFGDAYAATTDRQFVPALGVWLAGDRWQDELPTRRNPGPGAQAPKVTNAQRNLALALSIEGGIEDGPSRDSAALGRGIGN